jgi:hypothetical protein
MEKHSLSSLGRAAGGPGLSAAAPLCKLGLPPKAAGNAALCYTISVPKARATV